MKDSILKVLVDSTLARYDAHLNPINAILTHQCKTVKDGNTITMSYPHCRLTFNLNDIDWDAGVIMHAKYNDEDVEDVYILDCFDYVFYELNGEEIGYSIKKALKRNDTVSKNGIAQPSVVA